MGLKSSVKTMPCALSSLNTRCVNQAICSLFKLFGARLIAFWLAKKIKSLKSLPGSEINTVCCYRRAGDKDNEKNDSATDGFWWGIVHIMGLMIESERNVFSNAMTRPYYRVHPPTNTVNPGFLAMQGLVLL